MAEATVNLFVVECRAGEGVWTFFVPAHSPEGAIEQAKTSARETPAQHPTVTNPFQEVGLVVRVGNYEAPGSQTIIFGDWSPLK